MNHCKCCKVEIADNRKVCSFSCRNKLINANKNYSIQNKKANETRSKRIASLKIEKTVNCKKCNKELIVKTDSNGKIKEFYYCSRKCANSHVFSNETKNKQKIALFNKRIYCKCITCEKEIYYVSKIKLQCNKCRIEESKRNKKEFISSNLSDKQHYYRLAGFNFSLNTYIDEFDFSLVKKFGWYKSKRYGKEGNTKGISRDHLYSVSQAYKDNINPLIISHPANCRLIQHSENISKNYRCSVTIQELLEKIKNWEEKYGSFYNEELSINWK